MSDLVAKFQQIAGEGGKKKRKLRNCVCSLFIPLGNQRCGTAAPSSTIILNPGRLKTFKTIMEKEIKYNCL
jgi:hypothetical protein